MVSQLAVWIQGKTDRHKVVLLIHRRDDVPELCLVRQLLAWIRYANYTSGPLFTKSKNSVEPIRYSTFRSRAQKVALDVTKVRDVETETERKRRFGTHYLRKTAWLIGVWGGGSDVDLAAASRHRTLAQAPRYKMDASAMREVAINVGDPMALSAPRWRAIYVRSLQTCAGLAHGTEQSLPSLAENFMESLITNRFISRRNALNWSILACAILKSKTGTEVDRRIMELTTRVRLRLIGACL